MSEDPSDLATGSTQSLPNSWLTADRQDWQLGLLTLSMILVLGGGLLSFMFPSVFWTNNRSLFQEQDAAFYGFCFLIALSLAHLLQKQSALRKIRNELVQEKDRREQELLHNALHDPLTRLPNRELLLDRAEHCLAVQRRDKDSGFAVVFLDINRFNLVNVTLGHPIGDQVLLEVARRIQMCVRAVDTVARLGGDEFGILLVGVNQSADVSPAIERIQKELALPIAVGGQEIFSGASIGVAVSWSGYQHAEELLRDADTAMYRVKALGRKEFAFFDPSMHESAKRQLSLERDLRKAVREDDLVLHYQPIVRLTTGEVFGLEALVRWQHPQFGLLSPAEFLPVAQSAGLLIPLTRSVLRKVCRQLGEWQAEIPACWPLCVSINLPARFLADAERVNGIFSVISENNLQPCNIRLEITEDQLMENVEYVHEALAQLKNSGVRVYIDDFGTGFSSLSYLSTFRVDALKIDRSFILGLAGDSDNSSIIRSIVSLGHNLGIDVIAEGIETEEHLAFLRSVNCRYGQGYYFAKPMDPDAVRHSLPEWFSTNRTKEKSVRRLRAFELFADLAEEAVLEIAQTCEELLAPPATLLIEEGQLGDFIYLLEEGSVGVYNGKDGDSASVLALQAPAVIGEMALLSPEGTRTASVKALSDIRVLAVPVTSYRSLLRRAPAAKERLLELVAARSS